MEPCNQEKYFINLTIVLISMKCNHSNKVFHHQAHVGTNIHSSYNVCTYHIMFQLYKDENYVLLGNAPYQEG